MYGLAAVHRPGIYMHRSCQFCIVNCFVSYRVISLPCISRNSRVARSLHRFITVQDSAGRAHPLYLTVIRLQTQSEYSVTLSATLAIYKSGLIKLIISSRFARSLTALIALIWYPLIETSMLFTFTVAAETALNPESLITDCAAGHAHRARPCSSVNTRLPSTPYSMRIIHAAR